MRRGRRVLTTRADQSAARPSDLVKRTHTGNALWAMDLTYMLTWAGVAYTCFIVDT